jgi:hypothetical protein
MALSATPLIPRDGKITITDGGVLSLTGWYEDGDLTISGISRGQMQVKSYKSRGKTYSVRDTEDMDQEIAFSAHLTGLTGDGITAQLLDAIRRKGLWAAAVSTLPAANGDTYCLTITWQGERTNMGATSDSSFSLKYVHATADISEGDPGKISIKGTNYPISTDYETVS